MADLCEHPPCIYAGIYQAPRLLGAFLIRYFVAQLTLDKPTVFLISPLTKSIRSSICSFLLSGCGAVGSENCQWQFARKASDASCACNREVSGPRNVAAQRTATRE